MTTHSSLTITLITLLTAGAACRSADLTSEHEAHLTGSAGSGGSGGSGGSDDPEVAPDDGGDWDRPRDADGYPVASDDEDQEAEVVDAIGMYDNDDAGGPGYVDWNDDTGSLEMVPYAEGVTEDPATGLRSANASPWIQGGGPG